MKNYSKILTGICVGIGTSIAAAAVYLIVKEELKFREECETVDEEMRDEVQKLKKEVDDLDDISDADVDRVRKYYKKLRGEARSIERYRHLYHSENCFWRDLIERSDADAGVNPAVFILRDKVQRIEMEELKEEIAQERRERERMERERKEQERKERNI